MGYRTMVTSKRGKRAGLALGLVLLLAMSAILVGCGDSGGGGDNGGNNPSGSDLSLPDDLSITTESKRITADWTAEDDVRYDLYWSTDPDLDPAMAASAEMEPDIQPPFVLDDLQNDENYYFYFTAELGDQSLTTDRLDTRLASPGVGPNRSQMSVVQSDDGRVFVGGHFQYTGHSYGKLQVIDDRSGHQRAHPLEKSNVTAVAADGQGGYFYATAYPEEIRRVDANGQPDDDFLVTLDDPVLSMVAHDNTLYLGGEFRRAEGVSRDYLAAVTFNGDLLGWSPNPNREVYDLVVHNQVLYVAGDFINSLILEDSERSGVAAFDLDQNRSLMEWAPEPNDQVNALAAFDDRIVLGGRFTQISSEQREQLAFYDLEGNLLATDAELEGFDVNALSYHDGWLYVGGAFTAPQSNVFRMSPEGEVDTQWPAELPDNSPENLLATDHGVFVGTSIESGGQRFNNVFRYRNDGEVDKSIGLGLARAAEDMALVGDRVVLASTNYLRVSGNNWGLAVLDLEGRWQEFPVTLDGFVQSVRIHQGNLYAGGSFEEVSAPNTQEPVTRSGVAAFDLNNAELQSLSPQLSYPTFDHEVYDIVPLDDDFLIAGRFTSVNGTSRGNLARVDASGQLTGTLDDTDQITTTRLTTTALTDDYIYVGGTFSGFGGEGSAEHLVRLHRTGEDSGRIDTTWLPKISGIASANDFGTVSDIVVISGRVYLTGAFTEFEDTETRLHLAAIQTDGDLTDWSPELSGPSATRGFDLNYLSNEDAFLVTGTFDTVEGVETGRMALINRSDGTLNTSAPLANGLSNIEQTFFGYETSRNPATGNICAAMSSHEQGSRLWTGIYCMDHNGNLLW